MSEDILERAKAVVASETRIEIVSHDAIINELIAEVERLRSALCSPVETFGTPELVEWISAMHQLIVDFPESERGQIPFVMSMGELLTRGMNSWTAAKDARIKELEARLAEIEEDGDCLTAAYLLGGKKKADENKVLIAYVKRLEAAFLKTESQRLWDLGKSTGETSYDCREAREALERIKEAEG